MMFEVALVLGAIGFAMVVAYLYPERSRVWFYRIAKARRVAFGVAALLFAFVFIRTGSIWIMLLGFAILIYAGFYVVFEEPHRIAKEAVEEGWRRV